MQSADRFCVFKGLKLARYLNAYQDDTKVWRNSVRYSDVDVDLSFLGNEDTYETLPLVK